MALVLAGRGISQPHSKLFACTRLHARACATRSRCHVDITIHCNLRDCHRSKFSRAVSNGL